MTVGWQWWMRCRGSGGGGGGSDGDKSSSGPEEPIDSDEKKVVFQPV